MKNFIRENRRPLELMTEEEYNKGLYNSVMGEATREQTKKVYELFKNIFPNMDETKFDFAYTYGKFGLVGLTSCWFTKHPDYTPRQVAEMWFNITTLGLWGILSDEGKEVLKNAHDSD